jgi:hypothetical protein
LWSTVVVFVGLELAVVEKLFVGTVGSSLLRLTKYREIAGGSYSEVGHHQVDPGLAELRVRVVFRLVLLFLESFEVVPAQACN